MEFKNLEDFKRTLLDEMEVAVENAGGYVKDLLSLSVDQFYGEFEPNEYKRTEQIYKNLKKDITFTSGNRCLTSVYLDVDNINYEQGWVETQSGDWAYASWDKDTILDVVLHGGYSGKPHGGYADGRPIWDNFMSKIESRGDFEEILAKELKKVGIPIIEK